MPGSAHIFIVATPIGNLEDMTIRARRTLLEVDLIAAEDTRRARKLLTALEIPGKDVVSYGDHNEEVKHRDLVDRIKEQSLSLALISDAGTPCVSDPGYRLVRYAHHQEVPVTPIPGPSALTALISAAGLPSDRVHFVGFLPSKRSAMEKEIQSWRHLAGSIVFYLPMRQMEVALQQIEDAYPQAEVCVGRELSKVYEEIRLMTVAEAKVWHQSHDNPRGEASVMVHLGDDHSLTLKDKDEVTEMVRAQLEQGATTKDLLREFKDMGLSRSELYQLILDLKR